MRAPQLSCPICGRATPVSPAKHLPFCSDRCRLIDLGRWLEEEHVLASTGQDDSDQEGNVQSRTSESPSEERPPVRLPPGWHDA